MKVIKKMKKHLAIFCVLTLSMFSTACDVNKQDTIDNDVVRLCIDGVTYLYIHTYTGITVQLDQDGKVIPCKTIKQGHHIFYTQGN